MAITDELRRRVKDLFSKEDEITIRPARSARLLEKALPNLTSAEREKQIVSLSALAQVYYKGRHNEDVPKEMAERISEIAQRAKRLNDVDKAREIMHAHGGPPTAQSIAEALQRSEHERARKVEAAINKVVAANTVQTTPLKESQAQARLRETVSQAVSQTVEASLQKFKDEWALKPAQTIKKAAAVNQSVNQGVGM